MQPLEKQPDEAARRAEAAGKKLDEAVKKAEDAAKRLKPAEAGLLEPMSTPDHVETDADTPGAAAGKPG